MTTLLENDIETCETVLTKESTPNPIKRRKRGSNELDCLLLNPRFKLKSDSVWRMQRAEDPPLGLLALASYIRAEGNTVKILDCNIEAPEMEEFEQYFKEQYVDQGVFVRVFGVTTTTLTIYKAFKMAEICKRYYPDSVMVFGGAHASFVPDESLNEKDVDLVVIGEGEYTLNEILEGKDLNEIDGIAYTTDNGTEGMQVVKTKPRKRIKQLDDLPMSAYDLIDVPQYKPILGSYKKLPAMLMVSSRGCPWPCSFCRRPVGNMLTYRSAENIFEEIEFLVKNYGTREILFMDDVFTVNKKNVHKLCDLLIDSEMNVTWVCFARVDIVDLELLEKMKRAGCHQIMYGVENFDQGVLETMGKGINKEQVFEAVGWTKQVGIDIRLSFLIGLPGDTKEIILNNIQLIRELDPDILVVNIVTPFPGTYLYNWAAKRDLIATYDWDEYYCAHPIVKIEGVSADEIRRLYLKMIASFYFRPKYIFKKLLGIRSWTQIKMLISGFFGIGMFVLERLKQASFKGSQKAIPDPDFARKAKESALALAFNPTKQTGIT